MSATLLFYKRGIMRALDDLGEYTAASGTSTTVVIPALVNTDTEASVNRYDGHWIYVASGTGATQQRVVKRGGYAPSTGTLTVANAWTAPASGSVIHLTGLFPSTEAGGPNEDTSYRSFADRACALIETPDRVRMLKNGTDTQATTLWPWLDRSERLIDVLETGPVPGMHPVSVAWRNPRLVLSGPNPALEFDAPDMTPSVSDYWYLEVVRPGNTLINGLENETGLMLDTESALPTVQDVTKVGVMLASEALMGRSTGRPAGDWVTRHKLAQETARRLRYFDSTQEKPQQPAAAAAEVA